MILTDKIISKTKEYAFENEDYVIHTMADGISHDGVSRIRYKGEEYFNPWNEKVIAELGDPFEVFGKRKMEEFCIVVLAKKDIEALFCDNKEGYIYIGEGGLGKERYVLGQLGKKNMICFGINPSTAMPGDDDPTINRVKKMIKKRNCDGWIMLNMYPIRQTKLRELTKEPDKFAMRKNELIVRAILEKYSDAPIWAAWGTNITKYNHLGDLLINNLEEFKKREWLCRGKNSKDGHPHHPLYVADVEEFKEFDIEDYCKKLCDNRK